MNINKKILAIFPITLYLIANMLFYSVIFNDYVNRKVFFITGFLFLCNFLFCKLRKKHTAMGKISD